jgi:hypothetical protein
MFVVLLFYTAQSRRKNDENRPPITAPHRGASKEGVQVGGWRYPSQVPIGFMKSKMASVKGGVKIFYWGRYLATNYRSLGSISTLRKQIIIIFQKMNSFFNFGII